MTLPAARTLTHAARPLFRRPHAVEVRAGDVRVATLDTPQPFIQFRLGWDAYRDGHPSRNPHPRGSVGEYLWRRGYQAARSLAQKDAA